MDVTAIASTPPTTAAPSDGGLSAADEAAVFDQMAQGILSTGLSLMNSVIGDVISSISEPFGDPDQ